MALLAEQYLPPVQENGFQTNKDAVFGGNLTVTGTFTQSGTIALNGNVTIGDAATDTLTLTAQVTTDLTFVKEVNHVVSVATSTTATAVGGNLSVTAGAGATSGNGGIASLTGGVAGVTGAGGVSRVVGGAGGATSGAGGAAQLTGGAGTAGNGNGGDVVVTGGAAHGSGISGKIMNRSLASVSQGTPTAKTVSATLTAAEVLAGIITVNQAGAGSSAQQLPTATDLDTALPGFAAGDAFDFSVINTSTVDAEDASVTTNTGWTLVGSMDIHAYSAAGSLNSSGRFRARKTGAAAWTLYRIA